MQWSLSLKDQEEATLQFVQTSVEVFFILYNRVILYNIQKEI